MSQEPVTGHAVGQALKAESLLPRWWLATLAGWTSKASGFGFDHRPDLFRPFAEHEVELRGNGCSTHRVP